MINAKELRRALGDIVRGTRQRLRHTVRYGSRPAFRGIVPEDDSRPMELAKDPLCGAGPLGRSQAGDLAERHDDYPCGAESFLTAGFRGVP